MAAVTATCWLHDTRLRLPVVCSLLIIQESGSLLSAVCWLHNTRPRLLVVCSLLITQYKTQTPCCLQSADYTIQDSDSLLSAVCWLHNTRVRLLVVCSLLITQYKTQTPCCLQSADYTVLESGSPLSPICLCSGICTSSWKGTRLTSPMTCLSLVPMASWGSSPTSPFTSTSPLHLVVMGRSSLPGESCVRESISFHLYISTTPCGDGALFSLRWVLHCWQVWESWLVQPGILFFISFYLWINFKSRLIAVQPHVTDWMTVAERSALEHSPKWYTYSANSCDMASAAQNCNHLGACCVLTIEPHISLLCQVVFSFSACWVIFSGFIVQ